MLGGRALSPSNYTLSSTSSSNSSKSAAAAAPAAATASDEDDSDSSQSFDSYTSEALISDLERVIREQSRSRAGGGRPRRRRGGGSSRSSSAASLGQQRQEFEASSRVLQVLRECHTQRLALREQTQRLMDMVISSLQQQRQTTEQLRREAAVKRLSVSKAIEDLVKWIVEHEQEDCLLVGFSSQKSNPFREKSSCTII